MPEQPLLAKLDAVQHAAGAHHRHVAVDRGDVNHRVRVIKVFVPAGPIRMANAAARLTKATFHQAPPPV
ncbi:hypothetical protein [Spongiactinospora sp. TRM90649]|uniref:hypothetical protein n=1 Tax=Spongiactinospora sp. TRM90649 TaxID=3031114 RepID=UPI0023F9E15B|nr:hypothetical protein [Spongiactinospora sp. TRM90649]MDF5759279.1 hypothetical protein [Spongiactinospora sp. TRM90649]